jgi:hypothetical protein
MTHAYIIDRYRRRHLASIADLLMTYLFHSIQLNRFSKAPEAHLFNTARNSQVAISLLLALFKICRSILWVWHMYERIFAGTGHIFIIFPFRSYFVSLLTEKHIPPSFYFAPYVVSLLL